MLIYEIKKFNYKLKVVVLVIINVKSGKMGMNVFKIGNSSFGMILNDWYCFNNLRMLFNVK